MEKPQFTKLKKLLPQTSTTAPPPTGSETPPQNHKTAANWQKKLKANG